MKTISLQDPSVKQLLNDLKSLPSYDREKKLKETLAELQNQGYKLHHRTLKAFESVTYA